MNKLFSLCIAFFALISGGCAFVGYGKSFEVTNVDGIVVLVKNAGVKPQLSWGPNTWVTTEQGESLGITLQNFNEYDTTTALTFRSWEKDKTFIGTVSIEGIPVSNSSNYAEAFTVTREGVYRGSNRSFYPWIRPTTGTPCPEAPAVPCHKAPCPEIPPAPCHKNEFFKGFTSWFKTNSWGPLFLFTKER